MHDPVGWCDPWGLKDCNVLTKLEEKGYTGIVQNERGGLDYSNSNALYSNPGRLKADGSPVNPIVKIKYTGDYNADFEAANMAGFGQKSTPVLNGKKYTWHHLDDYNAETGEGTMQLVLQDAHSGMSHVGGVSQYQKATDTKYTFKTW